MQDSSKNINLPSCIRCLLSLEPQLRQMDGHTFDHCPILSPECLRQRSNFSSSSSIQGVEKVCIIRQILFLRKFLSLYKQFPLVANIDYRKVRGDLNLSMLSLQLLSPFNQGPQKKSPFNQENMQPSMDMHFFRKAPYEPSWLRPYYMYFKQKATHRSLI